MRTRPARKPWRTGWVAAALLLGLASVHADDPRDPPAPPPGRPALLRVAQGILEFSLKPLHPIRTAFETATGGLSILLPSPEHLPKHLRRPHDDYPALFAWVPRGWTAFRWGRPRLILGNQAHALRGAPKPIGESGSFQIARYPQLPFPLDCLPLYLAFTTPGGTHFRLGARWDDVDEYVQFPSIAIKRLRSRASK